jgi:glycosyltransferase involved in cell wall biosynthesis
MQNSFLIIVPVYNAVEYIGKCLDSIFSQNYKEFRVVVIDDCSDDGTIEVVKKYPVDIYINKQHMGTGLVGMIEAIRIFGKEEDIIVEVDGDDWLAGDFVLSYLNDVYQDDVWLTYGQYSPLSGKYKNYCCDLLDIKVKNEIGEWVDRPQHSYNYRESGIWVTSHLRTFKKWLWDKIDDNDFRDENGEYLKFACDAAAMYPMIEMAGIHIKFIDKVLYIYNDLNPKNIFRIDAVNSIKYSDYLIKKPVYREL